jgi:hypothetical protein
MASIDNRNANTIGAAAGHGHGGGHHDEGSYLTSRGGLIATIWDWATTIDHKKIGVMYLSAVLMMFFFGGVAALAVRTELLEPVRNPTEGVVTGQWLGSFLGVESTNIAKNNQHYNRVFTLHGAIMVFMVIIPSVPAALGNFFLPILIGAKDVAFPRLNLLSWYIYVTGSIFGVLAILLGGVDTGWTFYTPYSTTTDADQMRVVYMVLAAFILGFSSILTGLNFVVTVHKLRAPGMGWFDMPLFVWAVYASSILQVLATPVIGITLLLLVFERLFRIGIFDPGLGGDPVLFQHFFWFYSHPVVYVMILPGMAIINEIIPVHAHKKIFGYRSMAFASLGIAAVSFLVWGHHMFTSEGELAATVFSGPDLPGRRSDGGEGVQLGGHALQGVDLDDPAHGLRPDVPVPVHDRRADGPAAGDAVDRHAPARQLLRGGALPLRHDGRHDHRVRRRPPPLVAEDVRQDVQQPRGDHFRADPVRRVQRHLLHAVRAGHPRHAAAVRVVRGRIPAPAPDLNGRVVHPGGRVHGQPGGVRPLAAGRQEGAAEPLGRPDPRMAHREPAHDPQLPQRADRAPRPVRLRHRASARLGPRGLPRAQRARAGRGVRPGGALPRRTREALSSTAT